MNLSTESRKLNTLQGNFLVSSTPTKKIKIAREKNKQGKGEYSRLKNLKLNDKMEHRDLFRNQL